MLTIITGVPGTGKTAEMVSLMLGKLGGRPLYVDGVNGLKPDHEPIDAREWHKVVPTGQDAVVLVDEGQRRWRPRGSGAKVPPEIEAMETHRHGGIDFFITTQHPGLLDANLRLLAGRHIHLRDLGILGRWWYEWPETCHPVSWKSAPIKRKHKLDKKTFDQYISAEKHTKPIRSFPWMLAVLIVAVIGFAVLAFQTYRIINGKVAGTAAKAPTTAAATSVSPGIQSPASGAPGASAKPAYLTDATQFVPRLSGAPETAPAYDELRRVVVMPRLIGGYCQAEACYCFTEQGTDARLTTRDCRAWIENRPYDPYRLAEPLPGERTNAGGADSAARS